MVLICGFNRIYNTVRADPWGGTKPKKGKVARSVNSAPSSGVIVKYSSHCSQANLCRSLQDTAFTGLRFFTVFRRIPPARPAAIRRAFLLEELSYSPTPSDPLSSGLGSSAVSFSPDFSRFKNFPPDRTSPMNQVFLKEARVALDASKSSPSSACAKEKVRISN